MQCQCGYTAQYIVGRDGKPCHTCAHNRCKFWAIGPTSCEGYSRVVLGSSSPPEETIIVRFEALRHPEVKDSVRPLPAVMAMCEGDFSECHPVRQILEDPVYEGQWFSARKAYLYTLNQYAPLLSRLQKLSKESRSPLANRNARTDRGAVSSTASQPSYLNLLLEPIPHFFLKCWDEGNQYATQFSSVQPDTEDIVYQQLQPFQKKGVEFVLLHGGRGMIADEMGLGKTIQAIAVAHFYRDEWPLLVVCPMSLMENWAKEICRFCSIPFSRIGFIQGKKIVTNTGEVGQHGVQDVIIASYHALKELKMAVFQVLIFDESHYIKTPDSKRTIAALDLSKKAKRVVLLTGTPTLSRPMELYTQLRAIASSHAALLPTNNQFAARYCNAHIQSRGGMYTVNTDGHSHTDELHLLLQHFLIRREKKELQHALPSKSRQILYITVAEKGRASMAKMVSALKKTVTSHSASHGSGGSAHSTSNVGDTEEWGTHRSYPNAFELKIATAQVKIPAVMDYVASMVEKHRLSKQKMIVFAHHQCMMDALKDAVEKAAKSSVPVDYILICGETPAGQREELAEHFRNDPHCVVALLSMQSSGVGHNFTCASTVIFTELDWNPSTHLQCEDRVHRIGQSKPCVMQYLLAEGTSDSIIWPLLNTKLSVTTAVLSGSASNGGGGGGEGPEKNSPGNPTTTYSRSSGSSSHRASKGRDTKNMADGALGSGPSSSFLEAEVAERKPLRIGKDLVEGAIIGSQVSSAGGGTQPKLEDFFPVSSSQSLHPPSARTSAESHRPSMAAPPPCAVVEAEDEGIRPSATPPALPSPPLPLLMSFSAMGGMDRRWKCTGHAPSIPGCHRKVPPPLSSCSSSSASPPTTSDGKKNHVVPPPTMAAFFGAPDATEGQKGDQTTAAVAQGEMGGCRPPTGRGPPPPPSRRTTFKLPASRPPATASSSPVASADAVPSSTTFHSSPPPIAPSLPHTEAADDSPLLALSLSTARSCSASSSRIPPPLTPVLASTDPTAVQQVASVGQKRVREEDDARIAAEEAIVHGDLSSPPLHPTKEAAVLLTGEDGPLPPPGGKRAMGSVPPCAHAEKDGGGEASGKRELPSRIVRAEGGAKRTTMVWRAAPTPLSPVAVWTAPPPAGALTPPPPPPPSPMEGAVQGTPSSLAFTVAPPAMPSEGVPRSASHPDVPHAESFTEPELMVSASPPAPPLPSWTAPLPTAMGTPMVCSPFTVSLPSSSAPTDEGGHTKKRGGGAPDGAKRTMMSFSPIPPSPLGGGGVPSGRELATVSIRSSSSLSYGHTTAVEDEEGPPIALSPTPSPALRSDTLLQAVSRTAEGYLPGVRRTKTFLLHKPSS